MFSPYEYTWTTPGKGLFQIGVFVAAFLSVLVAVKVSLPEAPVWPREFEDGLEKELGGSGAIRVSRRSSLTHCIPHELTNTQARKEGDPEPSTTL